MDAFDALARDTTSSATALFGTAARLFVDARERRGDAVRAAAVRVCHAQPSMGALWNLAAAALDPDPASFERIVQRAARSVAASARHAAGLLGGDVARVITCSRSAAVEACVKALDVPVVCSESRPGLEGRTLAGDLSAAGLAVDVVADAAIASDLRAGDVVLVGADAVTAHWFINKTGTGSLCAAAMLAGMPAYAVAGREKFVSSLLAGALTLREEDPATLWEHPPVGVRVRNPLFERVSLDRVAGVISDVGLLAGEMIAAACEAAVAGQSARMLLDLVKH